MSSVEIVGGAGADIDATRLYWSRRSPALKLDASENNGPSTSAPAPVNVRTATSERSPCSFVELVLLGGDALFSFGDVDVELVLLVDGDGVVLGEDVGLLVEVVELIDDAIDLVLLVLDRGGAGDLGVDHRRREDDRRNQYDARLSRCVRVVIGRPAA